jgi:hypothetical protein
MNNSKIDTILNKATVFERSSTYLKKMETLGRGINSILGKNGKNETGTQFPNGIATPGTSLEPNKARNKAENARQAVAAAAAANGLTDQTIGGTDSKDSNKDNNNNNNNGEFISLEDYPPSKEQIEVV